MDVGTFTTGITAASTYYFVAVTFDQTTKKLSGYLANMTSTGVPMLVLNTTTVGNSSLKNQACKL